MAEEAKPDLSLVDTNDMIDEIVNRATSVALVFTRDLGNVDGKGPGRCLSHLRYKGNAGLLLLLTERLGAEVRAAAESHVDGLLGIKTEEADDDP